MENKKEEKSIDENELKELKQFLNEFKKRFRSKSGIVKTRRPRIRPPLNSKKYKF